MPYKDIIYAWFRRWRSLIIISIVVFVGLYSYSTHTFITLNTTKDSGLGYIQFSSYSNNGDNKPIFVIGSIAYVSRDTAQISAVSGDYSTSVDTSPLPWFGIKNFTISVERDKNAEKISGSNFGCSVYSITTSALSSYSCGNPYGLFTYQTSDVDNVSWGNKPSLTFPQSYNATTYRDGVIGISNNTNPILFYSSTTDNKTVQLGLPFDDMSKEERGSISVIADSTDNSRSHFLLVDNSTAIIYFGQQNNEQVSYRQYEYKATNFSPRFNTSRCVLVKQFGYCYFGNSSFSPDSEGETLQREKTGDGKVVVIDFSQQTATNKEYTVSKDEPVDQLIVDDLGNIYSLDGTTLYQIKVSGNSTSRLVLATNVSSAVANKSLFYISNNQLFEYSSQTKSTHMRFTSKNLRLSNVSLFGDTTLFNAYVNGAPTNTLHTYRLLNTPNTTPGNRLLDKIPFYPGTNQINISDIDYFKKTIHVVLPAYVTYNAANKIVPDDALYNEQKQEVNNYLSGIIPSFSDYKVTFSRPDRP